MIVEITTQDVQKAGHGNGNDPLVQALMRIAGNEKWRTEIYSHGNRLKQGGAWVADGDHFTIDAATTQALQEFDSRLVFEPRSAVLTEFKVGE